MTKDEKWAVNCGYVWQDIYTIYHPDMYLSLLLFYQQLTRDKNWTIWCGYVWQGKVSISSTVMYLAYILFYWHPWRPNTITGIIKITDFVYLLHSNKYVSNQFILDRNPRLSSYTIGVTQLDYISLLLVFGNFTLNSKRGVCWNLLKATPARIPLIKPSHKWTQILFIISNSTNGI